MRRFFLSLIAVLFIVSGHVYAHGVGVECRLDRAKNNVIVEAFYDDDTPASLADVVVKMESKVIAKGKTKANGVFYFPKPAPGKYVVHVDAGMGHAGKTTMTIAADAKASSSPTPTAKVAEASKADKDATSNPAASKVISDGPTRAESTRFPWLNLSIGLASIGLISLAFMVSRRKTRS